MPTSRDEHRQQIQAAFDYAVEAFDRKAEECRQAAAQQRETTFSVPLGDTPDRVHNRVAEVWRAAGWTVTPHRFPDGESLVFS